MKSVRAHKLFYNRHKANCASCHKGSFLTDHDFHAVAMPQIGSGRGDDLDGHGDFGRQQVTGKSEDRFTFRTPTLINIALTAAYGHDGAYTTLEAMMKHHLAPEKSLRNYDRSQTVLPSRADLDAIDFVVMDDSYRLDLIAAANELGEVQLTAKELTHLMDFLNALTDPAAIDLRKNTPWRVTTGIPFKE